MIAIYINTDQASIEVTERRVLAFVALEHPSAYYQAYANENKHNYRNNETVSLSAFADLTQNCHQLDRPVINDLLSLRVYRADTNEVCVLRDLVVQLYLVLLVGRRRYRLEI